MPHRNPDEQPAQRRFKVGRLIVIVGIVGLVWFLLRLPELSGSVEAAIQPVKEIYLQVAGVINSALHIDWGDKLAAGVVIAAPILLLVAFLFDDSPRR